MPPDTWRWLASIGKLDKQGMAAVCCWEWHERSGDLPFLKEVVRAVELRFGVRIARPAPPRGAGCSGRICRAGRGVVASNDGPGEETREGVLAWRLDAAGVYLPAISETIRVDADPTAYGGFGAAYIAANSAGSPVCMPAAAYWTACNNNHGSRSLAGSCSAARSTTRPVSSSGGSSSAVK